MVRRPQFTLEQRRCLVAWYWQGKSWSEIKAAFQQRFPGTRIPSHSTLHNLLNKFQDSATMHNLNKGHSGRRRTACTLANINLIRQQLQREMQLPVGAFRSSARRNNFMLSKTSFNRITKIHLQFKPYVLAKHCRLSERAKQLRVIMCQFLVRQPRHYFARLLISDEATFYLNGHVFNRKTNVCYGK